MGLAPLGKRLGEPLTCHVRTPWWEVSHLAPRRELSRDPSALALTSACQPPEPRGRNSLWFPSPPTSGPLSQQPPWTKTAVHGILQSRGWRDPCVTEEETEALRGDVTSPGSCHPSPPSQAASQVSLISHLPSSQGAALLLLGTCVSGFPFLHLAPELI